MLSRTVSIVAAFVVFVTTYALVLPAITMEKDARCGIEAHQHDDSCYELQLTCTQEEADGHVHTEDCFRVEQVLTCEIPEHQHSAENGCYDEEGNLVCTETEHVHDSQCYQENRELVCGLEESGGHHHDESCYEKVLICGKQVHTHGPECYEDDAGTADPGFTDGEGIVGPGTVGTESGGNESGQGDFGGDDQGGDVFDGQEYDFGAGGQGGNQFDQDPGSTDFGGDDFGGNEFEGRDDFSGGMEFIDAEPGGDSFDGGENWDADFTEETVFTDAEPPQQLYEEPYEEPYGESYVEEPAQEPYEEPYQEPYVEPVAEEAPVENGALTGQDDQNVQESGEGPAPEGKPAEGDEAEAGQAGDQTVENAESAGTETDAAAADQDAESQDAMGQDTADPETADLDENQQALDNEIDKDAEKEAGEKTEAADPEDDNKEAAENTNNKKETDNKEADKKEAGQDRKDDQDTSGTADSAKSNTGAAPADKTDTKPESTGYAAETTAADAYVPALDALDFNAILDKNTGIYYHAVEEDGVIEDSSLLYDWEKVKKDTELAPNDLLRIYLSYTIPAGSLNATNDIARYRLPGNIHLSDAQKAAINGFENGISGQYMNYDALEITDPGRHTAYIGAEAVEGRRRPGQTVEDYLAGLDKNEDGTDPQELISAVVRTEDVCDAEGSYIGTDLVFTFSTYTVDRNQHEYDKDGNQTKAGEKVCGWFCFDLNTSQIDWATVNVEESLYAVEAENNNIENNNAEENGTADSNADGSGAAGDVAAQASAQEAAAAAAGADGNLQTTETREKNTAENADNTGPTEAVQGVAEDNSEASAVDAQKAENLENGAAAETVEAAETAEAAGNTENAGAAETAEAAENAENVKAAETAEVLAEEKAENPQAADPSVQTNAPAAPEIVHATYQIVTTKEAEIIFTAAVIDRETGGEKEPISTKLVLKETEFETRDELQEPSAADPALAAEGAEPEQAAGTGADGQPGDDAGSEDTQASEAVENADRKEDAEAETTDADKENADKDNAAETDKQDKKDDVSYPAATFEDTITVHMGTLSTDTDSAAGLDIPDRTELTVHVEADEGTFPEGTTMVLTAVTGNDLDDVAQAVEGAVEGKTKGFYAVDITFRDADGKVIEPRKLVKVTMKGETIRKATENASTEPVVVHLEDTSATVASDADQADEGQAENGSEGPEKTEGAASDENGQKNDDAAAEKTGDRAENTDPADTETGEGPAAETADVPDTDPAAGNENGPALEKTETDDNADAAAGAGQEKTLDQDAVADHSAEAGHPAEAIEENAADPANTADPAAEKPAAAPTATVVETYRENAAGKKTDDKTANDTIMFEGDSFSIYAIVYTVDFHYEVNGKTYEFSIPGGGFVSLAHIIEALGINGADGYEAGAYKAEEKGANENRETVDETANGSENGKDNAEGNGEIAEAGAVNPETVENTDGSDQDSNNPDSVKSDSVKADYYADSINLNQLPVSEKTMQFVADIASVEFSSPGLVWVGKVDIGTNVGQLKKANKLEVQYSAELTQDQINEINSQTVEAGDWALISMQPFTTEESLTVTMQNGERFEVRVTDAQISTHVITADGEDYIITVTYGPEAGIPEGATLVAKEILNRTDEYENMLVQSLEALRDIEEMDVEILFSRFFDVSILNEKKEEIEPAEPVTVTVQYANPIKMINAKPSIVHFAENGIEVIEARARVKGEAEEGYFNVFEYKQESFSGIGTIVNAQTIADGEYFLVHDSGGKTYALSSEGSTVEVDKDNKTIKAKPGTSDEAEEQLLWKIKSHGNDFYTFESSNGEYLVLQDDGTIVGYGSSETSLLKVRTAYNSSGNLDGYNIYNAVNANDSSTWIGLGFSTEEQEYTTNATATRVRLAKYSMNSSPTGQPPAVNTYTGHPVDPKEVNDWLLSLLDDMPVGRFNGYSKTAEVYDYENRIYSVDFTAKSNSQGVTSNLDIAFSVDMSNSMLFPAALTEVGTVDMNQNAVATMLNGKENEVYFVVSDIPNTYTVNAIFYEGGKWKYEDASKWARGQRGGNNQDYVIPDSTRRISTKKDSNNNFIDTGTYTLYKAEGNYVKYVKDNEGAVWDNPYNRLAEMKTSLSIAFNFLSEMEKKYMVRIRVGWNGFASDVSANKTGTGNNTEIFNYSANPNDNNAKGVSLTNLSNVYWMDMISGFADAGAQTGGGTRPDKAFQDAIDYMGWDNNSNTKKVLVLITDGAPQGGDTTTNPMNESKSKGVALKTQKNVDIISIGLSTEHIDSADELFQYISATDSNGQKLVYQAKDGDVLRDALMDTLRQMVEQAITVGTIKDTIDPAFYLVSVDGTPLKVNDKIDLSGKLTTDVSKPYGVIGWDSTKQCWTVTWSEQDIVWPDEEHPYGWHGRVLIKAKENFLGGNDISTNKGEASLDVIDAKVKTTKNPDGSWNYRRVPFTTLADLTAEQLETRYMDTPHVNVDELEMTRNDTEWTVYLNTEVDPGEQIKALFNEIKVMKVVTDGVHEMVVPNGSTAKNVMVYDLVPTEDGNYSYEEASSDARDKRNVDQAFFYLKDLFNMKDSLNNDFILDNLTADQAIARLLAGQKVEVSYRGYGHGTTEKPVGKIILELKADLVAQVNNLNKHNASPSGDAVEKYILSAEYKPTESTLGEWYWNTGAFGTKDRGLEAEDKTKTNTHIINVIKRILTIRKIDYEGNVIDDNDAGEAVFEIYQKNESGQIINAATVTSSGGIYIWDYVVPDEDRKIPKDYWADTTTYYIKEKTAPKGYASFDGEITVTLDISDTATDIPNNGDNVKVPFNWTQTATLGASGDSQYVTVTGNGDIIVAVKNDKSVDIIVVKTDLEGREISGAKFVLLKGSALQKDIKVIKKGGSIDNKEDRISVDNGVFIIPVGGVSILGLGAGDYTLTESGAPDGYIKTLQPVKFSVDREGTVTYTNASDNPEPRVIPANDNKQYTVQNEPGVELPATGGSGTGLLYLMGILLMALAGAGLVLMHSRSADG